jgi:hypothetical protein
MRASHVLVLVLPAIGAGAITTQTGPPGSGLVNGTQLVYASGGTEQPPWVVESIERPATIGGQADCARIRLRMAPPPAAPEVRAWCLRDGVLSAFVDSTSTFRPLRPVGPGMTLDLPRAAGGLVRYETGDRERETIGTRTIDVIPTSVTTVDADGRAVRRLRERYALALVTATHGVFETPDSTQSSGWRVTQEFRLVAIR